MCSEALSAWGAASASPEVLRHPRGLVAAVQLLLIQRQAKRSGQDSSDTRGMLGRRGKTFCQSKAVCRVASFALICTLSVTFVLQ